MTWLLASKAQAFEKSQPDMGLDLLPTESLRDVFYPEEFLGVWDVESVLTEVATPLGEDMVPDMQVRKAFARFEFLFRYAYPNPTKASL